MNNIAINENYERKIKERLKVILELVYGIHNLYYFNSSKYQKSHIETIVGAGIWYIPNSMLWSGKISLEVIKCFDPEKANSNPKMTKDHYYPRKVSAREILGINWSEYDNPLGVLYEKYIEKYGRFHYVTPQENRKLVSYQKVDVFTTPESAYRDAGISLIEVSEKTLKEIVNGNYEVISKFLLKHEK